MSNCLLAADPKGTFLFQLRPVSLYLFSILDPPRDPGQAAGQQELLHERQGRQNRLPAVIGTGGVRVASHAQSFIRLGKLHTKRASETMFDNR